MESTVSRLHFEEPARRHGDPDFPLVAVPAGIATQHSPHCHDFYELVYIRHGGGVHVIEDRPYPMLRGDVYLMHPDDVHDYHDAEIDSAIVNVLFRPELFSAEEWQQLRAMPGLAPLLDDDRSAATHKVALTPNDAHLIERRCDRLIQEFRDRPPGWHLTTRAVFSDLLVLLARANQSYGRIGIESEQAPGPIASAIRTINRYWDQPMSVAELAALAGYSTNWFGERFHRETGLTVQAYQAKVRVDHARIMLEESDADITEVALDCGYDDPSYFGRVFKKVTGVTPREYRRRLQPA